MPKETIFVTRRIPEAGLKLIRKSARLNLWKSEENGIPPRKDVIAGFKKADVVLCLLSEKMDREIMEINPDLLGISNYAVGYDNIDINSATELGIPVTNTPDVLTDTTADTAWALIMAVSRRIVEADKFVRAKKFKLWTPGLMLGSDVSKGGFGKPKTLGIIGYGKIGKAVHKRASGFDMKVIAYDPSQKKVIDKTKNAAYRSLNRLLKESDFITIHTPLNKETKHLIGDKEFKLMKKSAFIINTSRGPVIDEKALIKALSKGMLAGAGLDVFEKEPYIPAELLKMQNVVLLPHAGSASHDTRDAMAVLAASNALKLLNGNKSSFTINPGVYKTKAYKNRIKQN